MAAAAFSWEWCPALGISFAGLVPLTLIVTFAPRLPILHAIPRIGAPKLKATLTPIARWDLPPDSAVLEVGIRAPTRLADAVVNLVLPYDVTFYRAHQDGSANPAPGTILTTDERVDGDRPSHYWHGTPDLRRGSTLLYFVCHVPRQPFKLRLRVDSETLYRPYEEASEIQLPRQEANDPPDWRSRGDFMDRQAGHLDNLEEERADVLHDLRYARDLVRREDLRGRLAHIDEQIEIQGDPRMGHREDLDLAVEQLRSRGTSFDSSGVPKSESVVGDLRGWALEAESVLRRAFPEWADRLHAHAPLDLDGAYRWLEERISELEEIQHGLDNESSHA